MLNPQFHPILTAVVLFFFGLVSPGPNFFVVIDATLKSGRPAGFVTGLGAATGDAFYACCGLFGVTQLFHTGGRVIPAVQLLGGLYLLWLGFRMLTRGRAFPEHTERSARSHPSRAKHFWRGLATDLANPKTIVFFASIFAVTVRPGITPAVRMAMLGAILLTSIAWRSFLSFVFSAPIIRRRYQRAEKMIESAFGLALCIFGVLLARQAVVSWRSL